MSDSLPELVGQAEIADRCHVSTAAVRLWMADATQEFPKPAYRLALGNIWLWSDVARWLDKTHRQHYTEGPVTKRARRGKAR